MHETIYDSLRWDTARSRALARDGHRCTVARLLGGRCTDRLDVHHVTPVSEGGAPYDVDNLITACSSHHPMVEAIRRAILRRRDPGRPRCPHVHRTREGREICERRLARAQGLEVAA